MAKSTCYQVPHLHFITIFSYFLSLRLKYFPQFFDLNCPQISALFVTAQPSYFGTVWSSGLSTSSHLSFFLILVAILCSSGFRVYIDMIMKSTVFLNVEPYTLLFVWLTPYRWRWKQYFPENRWWNTTSLHVITSEKIILFVMCQFQPSVS
jgi:hypothetical protein